MSLNRLMNEMLAMTKGGTINTARVTPSRADSQSGDQATLADAKRRLMEAAELALQRRPNTPRPIDNDVLQEMERGDVDAVLQTLRRKLIKRSKQTRNGSCKNLTQHAVKALDAMLSSCTHEEAEGDPVGAKDFVDEFKHMATTGSRRPQQGTVSEWTTKAGPVDTPGYGAQKPKTMKSGYDMDEAPLKQGAAKQAQKMEGKPSMSSRNKSNDPIGEDESVVKRALQHRLAGLSQMAAREQQVEWVTKGYPQLSDEELSAARAEIAAERRGEAVGRAVESLDTCAHLIDAQTTPVDEVAKVCEQLVNHALQNEGVLDLRAFRGNAHVSTTTLNLAIHEMVDRGLFTGGPSPYAKGFDFASPPSYQLDTTHELLGEAAMSDADVKRAAAAAGEKKVEKVWGDVESEEARIKGVKAQTGAKPIKEALASFQRSMEAATALAEYTQQPGNLHPGAYDKKAAVRKDNASYPTALKPVAQGKGYTAGEPGKVKTRGVNPGEPIGESTDRRSLQRPR